MDLVKALHLLSQPTGHQLLSSVYAHSRDVATKLWIIAGYSISDMPDNMLTHVSSTGILDINHLGIDTKPKTINVNMFSSAYYPIKPKDYDSDKAKALDILSQLPGPPVNYQMPQYQYRYATAAIIDRDKDRILALAAIATDDLAAITQFATMPTFAFDSEKINFAAKFGAIKCFRFLSLNGCKIVSDTLKSAMQSGNEEIIQLCLEQNIKVEQSFLLGAISFHQNKVANWLIEIYGLKVTFVEFKAAFEASNWRFVCDYFPAAPLQMIDNLKPKLTPTVITVSDEEEEDEEQYYGRYDKYRYYHEEEEEEDKKDAPIKRGPIDQKIVDMFEATNQPVECRQLLLALLTTESTAGEIKNAIVNDHDLLTRYDSPEILELASANNYPSRLVSTAAAHQATKLMALFQAKGVIDVLDAGSNALSRAIDKDRSDVASILLRFGADPNCQIGPSETPFKKAIESKNLDIVRGCFEHGGASRVGGLPTLFFAATLTDQPIIEYFVRQGLDVNEQAPDGSTALIECCKRKKADCVKFLIAHGADVNMADSKGRTALMCSLATTDTVYTFRMYKMSMPDAASYEIERLRPKKSNIECAKALLTHGADVNAKSVDGITALMYAAASPMTAESVFGTLATKGVDLQATNNQGRSALFYATMCDLALPITKLCALGLDPNASDLKGCTPLMYAVTFNTKIAAEALLSHKANPDAVSKTGQTALMMLPDTNSAEMGEILMKYNAKGGVADNNGNIALFKALQLAQMKLCRYLIQQGDSLTAVNADGQTALMFACMQVSREPIGLAMSRASVNAADKDGMTAIMYFVDRFARDRYAYIVIGMFTANGVNLNAADAHGRTVLMHTITGRNAAGYKRMKRDALKVILDQPLDINKADENGQTALFYAVKGNNYNTIKRLRELGANFNLVDNFGKTIRQYGYYG